MLARGLTRETKIRRDRHGQWFDDDVAIEHDNLARSFDGWIDRAPDGRFCLSNNINWAFVAIAGAPYVVRSIAIADPITLHLSGDRHEPLDPGSLRLDPHDAMWCDVREGRVPARFSSHALHQLGDLLDEDSEGLYLLIAGHKIRPPTMKDPMQTWTPAKGHVS